MTFRHYKKNRNNPLFIFGLYFLKIEFCTGRCCGVNSGIPELCGNYGARHPAEWPDESNVQSRSLTAKRLRRFFINSITDSICLPDGWPVPEAN